MYYAQNTYRKGMAPIGSAGYGVIVGWVPRKKRLAECKKMQYWYGKYIKATTKQKRLPSFLGLRAGAENRKYRRLRKEYERKGKAAWKKCKLTGRSDDATTMRNESMGLENEVTGYTDEYVVSDGQTQMQMSGGEFDATPVDYSDGASPKSPILLYAGLGGGALLLLLLLRRRKR